MALSRPFKEDRRALIPLSTPLSSRRSMAWCPWFCARRYCLKFINTSHLPRCKALMVVTFSASLSARSCPFTPACQTSASTVVFEDGFRITLCGTLYYGTSCVGLAVRSCAGKQKDLSSIPLRLSSLFRSRGFWTVFDIFAPHYK